MNAAPSPMPLRRRRPAAGFDYHRSEAYQLARVLTGTCSAFPEAEELRHAAVAATRHIADGMLESDSGERQLHFRKALLSLEELARQVAAAREAGRLPEAQAESLLACRARAQDAVESVALPLSRAHDPAC